MRQLAWVLALAACGSDSSAVVDAGSDDATPPPDAPMTAEQCDAPALFFEGITPTRLLHVAADAAPGGDGSLAAPFRTIQATRSSRPATAA